MSNCPNPSFLILSLNNLVHSYNFHNLSDLYDRGGEYVIYSSNKPHKCFLYGLSPNTKMLVPYTRHSVSVKCYRHPFLGQQQTSLIYPSTFSRLRSLKPIRRFNTDKILSKIILKSMAIFRGP